MRYHARGEEGSGATFAPCFFSERQTVTLFDVICIGAGPTGLACAIEAKRAALRPLGIDKGCLCNS